MMRIIPILPNESGAHGEVHDLLIATPIEGYAAIPDTLDMTDFYAYNGFVTLTIEDNTVTGYTPNIEAWEAWKASLPPEPVPAMTLEEAILDKLTELEYRQDLITLGLEGGAST